MKYTDGGATKNFKVQSKLDIKNRIASANVESPIAVFTVIRNGVKHLTSVFADTIYTRKLIENNHPDLIGVFHNFSDIVKVKRLLNVALNQQDNSLSDLNDLGKKKDRSFHARFVSDDLEQQTKIKNKL